MIKIYKEHQGVTNILGRINAGNELITHDVLASLNTRGRGFLLLEVLELLLLFQYLEILCTKKSLPANAS
jgi:hypothetical protein